MVKKKKKYSVHFCFASRKKDGQFFFFPGNTMPTLALPGKSMVIKVLQKYRANVRFMDDGKMPKKHKASAGFI